MLWDLGSCLLLLNITKIYNRTILNSCSTGLGCHKNAVKHGVTAKQEQWWEDPCRSTGAKCHWNRAGKSCSEQCKGRERARTRFLKKSADFEDFWRNCRSKAKIPLLVHLELLPEWKKFLRLCLQNCVFRFQSRLYNIADLTAVSNFYTYNLNSNNDFSRETFISRSCLPQRRFQVHWFSLSQDFCRLV